MVEMKKLDEDFFVGGQLSVEDIRALAKEGFRGIINNRPDGEEPGQPDSATLEAAAREAGVHYIYLPMNSREVDAGTRAEFQEALADREGPWFAFCRSGARSTCLWEAAQPGASQ